MLKQYRFRKIMKKHEKTKKSDHFAKSLSKQMSGFLKGTFLWKHKNPVSAKTLEKNNVKNMFFSSKNIKKTRA